MKKMIFVLYLFGVFFCNFNNCFAELKEGDWLIEGDTELNSRNDKASVSVNNSDSETKYNETKFDISIEKLLTNNISIGGTFGYEKDNTETEIKSTNDTSILYGLSGTFYFNHEEKFNPYVSIGLVKVEGDSTDTTSNGTAFGNAIGFLYFFNDKAALNCNYSYLTADLNYDFKDTNSNGSGDLVSQGLNFGFTLKF